MSWFNHSSFFQNFVTLFGGVLLLTAALSSLSSQWTTVDSSVSWSKVFCCGYLFHGMTGRGIWKGFISQDPLRVHAELVSWLALRWTAPITWECCSRCPIFWDQSDYCVYSLLTNATPPSFFSNTFLWKIKNNSPIQKKVN